MKKRLTMSAVVAAGVWLTTSACGDDPLLLPPEVDAGSPDGSVPRPPTPPSPDAGDTQPDGGNTQPDAGDTDLVKHVTVKLEDLMEALPPVGPTSYGFATAETPYGGTGTSWRYQKPLSGHKDEKFEIYFPFSTTAAAIGGSALAANLVEVLEHLGPITVADIASFKVRTRRNDTETNDFTLIVYTEPSSDTAKNDGAFYARRLHAQLDWAHALDAPAETWNEFATKAGKNELRFWDFRSANPSAGPQPTDNQFSLAEMQAGPVTPDGLTDARDYRSEKVAFVALTTYSNYTAFDASIDGIELTLKNGKGVTVNLDGDPNFRRISVSQSRLNVADPPDASSSSTFGTVADGDPWSDAGKSWSFKKESGGAKFELYAIFSVPADADDATKAKAAVWKGAQDHLGAFKIEDIESISAQSKRNGTTSANDFTMIVYTLPGSDGENDTGWYRRRLHAQFDWAADHVAPEDTWNVFSTNGTTNKLRFWDFRKTNASPGDPPAYFTLAEMQAAEIAPAGLEPRDYRDETVRYINFSTYTNYTSFDANIDAIDVRLKNKKRLVIDLDK